MPRSLFASRPRIPASPCQTPRPRCRTFCLASSFALVLAFVALAFLAVAPRLQAQLPAPPPALAPTDLSSLQTTPSALQRARAQRFAAARRVAPSSPTRTPAEALAAARLQSTTLAAARTQSTAEPVARNALPAARSARPAAANLTAPWTPLGPSSLVSALYGNVTGRVTALALDPNDPTGNTLYLGSTGGGVWKSTNAAGPLSAARFAPLTDDLPAFSAGSGSSVLPSLSIGALAIQPQANPILLAGTGDPNSATDSLYGQGILRSTDGGSTWTLAQLSHDGVNGIHSFAGLATAQITFSTATPALVVAAMSTSAEGQLTGAGTTVSVPGLYYSTDAGQTWQMATLYDGAQVIQQPQPYGQAQIGNPATAVVWDPQRAMFVAAIRAHGYYSSPDGATWTRLSAQPGAGLTSANCPANPGTTGAATCPLFRGALAVQPATGDLYALTVDASNLDQGLWQDLCNLIGNTCTTPAPTFSTRLDNGALEAGPGAGSGTSPTAIPQGTYNLTLAAAPTPSSGTLLFAGTIDLYRCAIAANSASCTLRNTTNAVNGCAAPAHVAPAQHALAVLSQSTASPLLFLGNDSGLWRSLDGVAETGAPCSATDATHFDNLNAALGFGGSLAEVVGFAQHPSDPNTLLAGLGQNGSGATSAASALAPWPQLAAGEGGFPLLDPTTPNNWLLAIGAEVNEMLCPFGPNCTASDFTPPASIGEAQVAYDAAALDAPTLLDPTLTTNLLTATCRVWRGPASGSGWTSANALSPAFDGGATPCTASSALVRSLAAGGPAATASALQWTGAKVLYAGLSGVQDGGNASIGGHVFVTEAANTSSSTTPWTDIGRSPVTNDANGFNPAGFDVSALATDPHDPTGATVYATILGFGEPHLYLSADFGAHWSSISSNLPDAPANAVLVDPNDANTVYVALDTGVYVTTAVHTCATANCWDLLGTGLPNAPITSLAAAAGLPVGDGRFGLLRAGTYGRGLWSTPLLTAAAPLVPGISLSAPSLTFPMTAVGSTSAAQTLTVTSTGNTPLALGQLTLPAGFTAATDTCSGQSLPAGQTCSVAIAFAPLAAGPATGQLTVPSNAAASPATVTLSGNAVNPATDTLAPTALTFAPQQVATSSAAQTITLTNSGDLALAIPSIATTSAEFSEANTCGASLAAHSACTLSVSFTPSTTGVRSGTLTVADATRTQTIALTGTGVAPPGVSLTPITLAFTTQQIATTSPAQTITLTNNGGLPLTLASAIVAGPFAVASTTCTATLAVNASCSYSVTFSPTASGSATGTLTLSDNATPATQTVTFTGTGAQPAAAQLAPSSLTFANVPINTVSAPQTVTLTNTGGLPLTLSATTITPPFAMASATCAGTLAAGASCTFAISFAPTAAGPASGTLTLADNAAPSPQTVTLTGTAFSPATLVLTPTSLTFPSTVVNQTALTQVITVSNTGGVPATLQSPSISGDFTLANNTCGATLAPSTGCSLAIAFTPTAGGARSGTLTVTATASGQTLTAIALLSGNGYAPATDTLAPLAVTFATQQIATASAPQQVTLTNAGDVALTGISTSSSSTQFGVVNNCTASLSGHSTCALVITFTPSASGPQTATLTVADQFRTQTVALTGTGAAPPGVSLTPASLTFAPTGVSLSAVSQAVTLTNNGGLPLSIASLAASAGFGIASSTCGSTLAAGAACTLQMVFAPLAAGAASGTLTVVTNATPTTQTVALAGAGVDFTLSATGPTTQTVSSGLTATYALQLSSLASLSGAVALACTGAPTNAHCLISPGSGALGSTQAITVTVTTGVAALSPGPRLPWQRDAPIVLALCLPTWLARRRRRRPIPQHIKPPCALRANALRTIVSSPNASPASALPSRAPATLGLLLTLLAAALSFSANGCGAGRTIPPGAVTSNPTPTPSGTYNLTVSASAAGLTHTQPLTLTVQ